MNTKTYLETASAEIINGLLQKQKQIPSRFFYDETGSKLFDEICSTEEYYLTRSEIKILKENAKEISESLGSNILLIEYGSGSGIKTKILLENADITGYIPIEISYEYLMQHISGLKDIFPDLKIYPMPADFSEKFELPAIDNTFGRKIVFFPGSTIGNFIPGDAQKLLMKTKEIVGRHGGMLAGFDLIKDTRILENAYNDRAGITAEFNLNILNNINKIAGTDFRKENFEHLAFYNEHENRMEMHLISKRDQAIQSGDRIISISRGETIITEYSYKYSIEDIEELVKDIFRIEKIWMDKNKFFAEVLLVKN